MKRISIFLTALALAFAARAENSLNILSWTVENAHMKDSAETVNFMAASVGIVGYAGYLLETKNLEAESFVFALNQGGSSLDTGTKSFWQSAVPEGVTLTDDTRFYVDLWNVDEEVFARSETITYASLRDSGFIFKSASTEFPSGNGWSANNFHAVPEPTGGLLMLLGFAALALKRKNA